MLHNDDDVDRASSLSLLWDEVSQHPKLSGLWIQQFKVNSPYAVSVWHSDRRAYIVSRRHKLEDALRSLLVIAEPAVRGPRRKA